MIIQTYSGIILFSMNTYVVGTTGLDKNRYQVNSFLISRKKPRHF